MTSRSRHLLLATIVAIPFIAFSGPTAGHNGRDRGKASTGSQPAAPVAVSTTHGITITTDPKTGVRTYTQTGAVAPNPALAKTSPVRGSGGPGLDYWVRQSEGGGGAYAGPPGNTTSYIQPSHDDSYDESIAYSDYGYGGYLPVYGYGGGDRRPGGGGDRPGHGGRPGRPGGGDPLNENLPGGINHLPGSGWSPPPGPAGGGVGSPPPRQGGGIGAPPPQPRDVFRGGGRRR